MKTKDVLIALCLPAMFAACNSEELIDNGVANTLNGRAKVNLKVNVSPDVQVDTRMISDGKGGFLWESTDQLGAVIVDPATLNTVAASAHLGNNRFKNNLAPGTSNQNASFFTDGTTVEGAWMFYYPYSEEMSSSRGGIKFGTEEKSIKNQKYDKDGALMAKNDFRISPVIFVDSNEGGETTVDIKPASIYAYGTINAQLPTGVTTVNRVVLDGSSTPFVVGGTIDATKVVAKAALNYSSKSADGDLSAYQVAIAASTNDGKPDATLARAAFADQSDTYATGDITDIWGGTTTSPYIVLECTDAEGNGTAVTNGEFYSRILLPAQKTKVIDVYFYTNAGVYKKQIAAQSYFKRNHTVNLADVNRETEDYKTAKWDIQEKDKAATAPIVTTDDLVSIIQGAKGALDISSDLVTDGDVVFNDAVAAALAGNAQLTALTVADINVACGSEASASTIGKLTATGTVTVKGGSNVVLNGTNDIATLAIEEGAKAEIAAGTYSAAVTSNGTLSIKSTFDASLTVAGGVTTIDETISKGSGVVSVTGGKLAIAAGKQFTIGAESSSLTTLTDTEKFGTIEVPATATLSIGAACTNSGVINNEGTINGAAVLTNSGTINNGTAENQAAEIIAPVTNSATYTITNYGRMDALNNTAGLLVAKKQSFTTFASGRGTVDNTDSNGSTIFDQASFSGDDTNSDIFVTLSADQTNELASGNTFPTCDRIVLDNLAWTVDKDVTITHKLDFKGNTSILVNKTSENAGVTLTLSGDINILEGKATWAGSSSENAISVTNLTVVAANAEAAAKAIWYIKTLKVTGSGATLTINGTIDNWGTVNSAGFNTITYGPNVIKKGTAVAEK